MAALQSWINTGVNKLDKKYGAILGPLVGLAYTTTLEDLTHLFDDLVAAKKKLAKEKKKKEES